MKEMRISILWLREVEKEEEKNNSPQATKQNGPLAVL